MVIYLTLAAAILAGIYSFRYLRRAAGARIARWVYLTLAAGTLVYAVADNLPHPSLYGVARAVAVAVIFYACVSIPLSLAGLAQDIFSLVRRMIKGTWPQRPSRIIFFLGCLTALAGLAVLTEGMVRGKTDFRIERFTLKSPRVPAAFHGYRIAQISDLHLGSFSPDSPDVPRALKMVQALDADMIVLTGDILNDNSADMLPWIDHLAALKAPDGKYAVIGNHDYCEYDRSLTPAQRTEQMDSLRAYYRRAGFEVLDNQSAALARGSDTLYLAGVENWGTGPFPARGDLDAATERIPAGGFTVLLSHDPAHFQHIVSRYRQQIDLTLSGHTHAMQFGIRLGRKFQWSPIQYRYPYWAGPYRKNGRVLYVNRGLGYHFFPARIGMRPEITLITLEQGASPLR